jgi:Rrf2 family protein
MLFSKSGEYALLALLYLAEHGEEGPLRTSEIASAIGVPRNYLSKILHQLAQADVLRSERGPRGGFELTWEPEDMTLAEALRPIESDLIDRRCLLGRSHCSDDDPCAAHASWQKVSDHIADFVQNTTLADLTCTGSGPT